MAGMTADGAVGLWRPPHAITAGVSAGEGAQVGASPRIPTPETICNATSLGKSLARMGGRPE